MAKQYRCGCGVDVSNKKALIKHYQEVHPDDAYQLYDQIGTIGDKFADLALQMYHNKVLLLQQQLKAENTVDNLMDKIVDSCIKEKMDFVCVAYKGNLARFTLTDSIPTNIGLATMLLKKASTYINTDTEEKP